MAPYHEHTSKALGHGTRSQGSHSFTCTPRVHPLTEWTIPAFGWWSGIVVRALASINESTPAPVSTEMGDRVPIQFLVPDIYFGM